MSNCLSELNNRVVRLKCLLNSINGCESNIAAKIWNKIPNEIKEACSLTVFKSKIKKWVPEGYPCRLCKTYVGQVGFI